MRAKRLWRRRSEQDKLDPAVVRARLDRQHGRILRTEHDLMRIGTQVAALESRVENLRERLDLGAPAPGEPGDEARSIVEEMRREHERVRVRISAAVRYEERLRQLEERLAVLEKQDKEVS